MNKKTLFIITLSIVLLMVCSERTIAQTGTFNPRDTVVVPEGYTGEDSIAYIENAILKSPISAKDLLGLAEVHDVEGFAFYYNNFEEAEENPELADRCFATAEDSAAMRLANRFMRMSNLVEMNGNAKDKLEWAAAVNTVLNAYREEMPEIPSDSVLNEIEDVLDRFSLYTQMEMNFQTYVHATVEYYRTIEAYRKLLLEVPTNLKPLIQEEYEAWHDLNEARFAFWNDVSFEQGWYSMKPMIINGYYENLSANRRAQLDVERGIILEGKAYRQKGKTVTTNQWEQWIKENSVPEDIDLLRENGYDDLIPSDSLVAERVKTLKSSFARWLAARQAIAAALPEAQGKSYDKMTADIHCRMIGKLPDTIPFDPW